MTSLEIAELVDSRHDKVRQSIERLAERGVFTLPPLGEVSNPGMGPANISVYRMDKRSSLIAVAQLCPEFTARIVDRWQELEAGAVPAVPQSLSAALRLAADQAEQIEALAIERDHAIATKAQIGDRRQATSMAKVAVANREVAKLKDQLGFSARHATILQVEDATGGDFGFLELRRWCKAHEVTPETVPDKRYPKGIKAWPAGAWMAVYNINLTRLFGEVVA